jgi:glycerol-3-phosphate acyltransferase PlsY
MGSLPTSLLVARYVQGIDLREFGSGNVGATNLYRAAGFRYAALAGAVDIAKGFVPTWFFPALDGVAAPQLALAYGSAAVVGHIFSAWVGFRGGKGVATGAGAYLAMAPMAVGLGTLVWIIVVFVTRIVSVGSLIAAASLSEWVWLTRQQFDYVFWSTLPLVALVWWTHRTNIARLLKGVEPRTSRTPSEPVPESGTGSGSAGEG